MGGGCYFLWHNTMLSNGEALIDSCPSKFRYEMWMISPQPGHPIIGFWVKKIMLFWVPYVNKIPMVYKEDPGLQVSNRMCSRQGLVFRRNSALVLFILIRDHLLAFYTLIKWKSMFYYHMIKMHWALVNFSQ